MLATRMAFFVTALLASLLVVMATTAAWCCQYGWAALALAAAVPLAALAGQLKSRLDVVEFLEHEVARLRVQRDALILERASLRNALQVCHRVSPQAAILRGPDGRRRNSGQEAL